jgi:hypothetical protein
MLSRENVIHRSAGEERQVRVRLAGAGAGSDALLKGRIWGKLVLLILLAGLIGAFVLLNQGAVVEPRLHVVFFQFERPDLLRGAVAHVVRQRGRRAPGSHGPSQNEPGPRRPAAPINGTGGTRGRPDKGAGGRFGL